MLAASRARVAARRSSRRRCRRSCRRRCRARTSAARRDGAVDGVHRSGAVADRADRRVRALGAARADAEPVRARRATGRCARRSRSACTRAGSTSRPTRSSITTGSQQSLDIVARSLAVRARSRSSRRSTRTRSCCSRASATSSSGSTSIRSAASISTRGTARSRPKPSLAYLIPSFHNPTGYSYTSAELRGVLELCAQPRRRDPRGRLGQRHAVRRRVPADAAHARRQERAVRELVHEEAAAVAAHRLRRRGARARADAGRDEAAVDARQRVADRGGRRRVPRSRLLRHAPAGAAARARPRATRPAWPRSTS